MSIPSQKNLNDGERKKEKLLGFNRFGWIDWGLVPNIQIWFSRFDLVFGIGKKGLEAN